MKNKIKYIIVSIVSVLLFTGCEEWLDVNQNPNAIVDSPAITEDIYLIGVQSEWVQKISDSWYWWGGGIREWTCYTSRQQSTTASFIISPGHMAHQWNCYSGSLNHTVALYEKAEGNNHNHYQGIAAIIAAWHWFMLADFYDKAPLEQAMKGSEYPYPEVADQDELYAHANALLDEAVTLLSGDDGGKPVGNDDYMLEGDTDKWIRAAYAIKARQALRLSYATGTTPEAQADAALAALANAMTSIDDNVVWRHSTDAGYWSWVYDDMLEAYTGEGMSPNIFLVDLMNYFNDPRRYIMFTEAEQGGFKGLRAGAMYDPGDKPSRYRWDYANESFPDHIITYHECKFIEAEAYALKSDWANCKTALDEAITADMMWEGVPADSITAYLAQPELDVPTNVEDAQKLVIEQKYIANLFETRTQYFDWIRTGYPEYDFDYAIENVDNTETFPRRLLYPQDEIDKNPNIQALGLPNVHEKGTSWDNKPRK
ncbi:MAG: SusD/RagB family nutrient-binding outer membrane lipoprotein [Bacteroidales bacterium]|nr:SusD/RagB family nutrient-binding outer membrane lipoprotein [Bacteroidales bacterium]